MTTLAEYVAAEVDGAKPFTAETLNRIGTVIGQPHPAATA